MRRGWWALVVLAAVVAMHGLQCVGADSHPSAGHGVGSTVVALALPVTSGVELSVPSDAPAPPGAPTPPGHAAHQLAPDGASSDVPADFWAVCLAVLSAGLALLAGVLRRPGASARAVVAVTSVRIWVSAPALRRPPDIFALCVLRN